MVGKPLTLVMQIYDIKMKRDGARVQLDCGLESLPAIQDLIGFMANNDLNLAVSIVPFTEGKPHVSRNGTVDVDNSTDEAAQEEGY